jgi:hypothetical protein
LLFVSLFWFCTRPQCLFLSGFSPTAYS